MIKAIAKIDTDILKKMDHMSYSYYVKRGKRPNGFILGAQDYLEFTAAVQDMRLYEITGHFNKETSFSGIPIRVSEITRRLELEIDPDDAIYSTRYLVEPPQETEKA